MSDWIERAYGPARAGVVAQAAADLRSWPGARPAIWLGAGWAVVVAALLIVGDPLSLQRAAAGLYLLVALYGLRLLVVQTGQPSLGHAAFLAVGAYLTAFLRLRAGLDGVSAAVMAALTAGAMGWLIGRGSSRLRPAFVALSTWAFGWLVSISIGAFPSVSGGVAGITFNAPLVVRLEPLGILLRFNEAGHVVLASVLLALVMLGLRSAEESWLRPAWAAVKDREALASALGCDVASMRRWAFVAAAALAGLSGSLAAQMLGVVDPTLYGAPVSLGLFVAVLIGSRVGFFGPFVGAGVIGGLPLLAGALIPSVATAPARGVAVAGLTIVALVLGLGTGSIDTTPPDSAPPDATPIGAGGRQPAAARAPRGRTRASRRQLLVAGALCRSFGGVRALDSVDLTVREGEIHAIIGPNGSGKSTLLKCLTGAIEVDSGHVTLGAESLDGLSERQRSRAGVVRTFQRVVLMPGMSAREHVELGLSTRAADSGWLLTLLKTPAHRGSTRARLEAADSILETFGLARWADSIPPAMPGGRQRLLQVATAAATGPKILLLDEPAAGMGTAELEILAGALGRLRDMGVTMVLVEHNISFVARLAERVTVLDGGRTLAEGTPRQVVADSRVRAAYLSGSTANVP